MSTSTINTGMNTIIIISIRANKFIIPVKNSIILIRISSRIILISTIITIIKKGAAVQRKRVEVVKNKIIIRSYPFKVQKKSISSKF